MCAKIRLAYHQWSATAAILCATSDSSKNGIRRAITNQLFIQSVLNEDEVFVKLAAIIEARNCIVHSAAVVSDAKTVERLRAYAIHHSVGESLQLKDNLFDDFLHYMGIHITAFVKRLP